jgi:hypothetical protein
VGPGGGRHHFAPDDEGAFEYENYNSHDHTHYLGSVVGDLCFDACFNQLEPKPSSRGQTKKN